MQVSQVSLLSPDEMCLLRLRLQDLSAHDSLPLRAICYLGWPSNPKVRARFLEKLVNEWYGGESGSRRTDCPRNVGYLAVPMACADTHRCGWQGGIIPLEDRPHDTVKLMENGKMLNRRLLGGARGWGIRGTGRIPYCSQRQHRIGWKEEKYLPYLRGFSKTNQVSGSYNGVVCLVRCHVVSQAYHVIESCREASNGCSQGMWLLLQDHKHESSLSVGFMTNGQLRREKSEQFPTEVKRGGGKGL
jgi:hypothetical protein